MEVHNFGVAPITCHAWNKDRTEVALSLNSAEVEIHHREGSRWNRTRTLSQHELRVTSIDWAPRTNRIVTCAADRNAYVWTLGPSQQGKGDEWNPVLVLLRINRAATCVRWSPQEDKFAVGCGAKLVSVCYFEEANNWWLSKHIKKQIKSTVTCLDWHPNNCLLACGSTDFRARISSAYIKEVDSVPEVTPWGEKATSFGHLMHELSNSGGWIHSVSFSADGNRLAWVGHDSSVSVVDAAHNMALVTVRTPFLPFLSCTWLSNNRILVAGYDCCPMLYDYNGGQLTFVDKLDKSQKKEVDGVSAMRKFRNMDKHAAESRDTLLDTAHQNTITNVAIYQGSKGEVTKFTTSGMDGNLVIWDLKSLESSLAGLRIV